MPETVPVPDRGIRAPKAGIIVCLVGFFSLQSGCDSTGPAAPSPVVPEVTVAVPVPQEITSYEYFTGRAEARERVDLKARVSGHLVKVHFIPGTDITKDDLLIEIDARPFQTDLEQSTASVSQADAKLTRVQGTLERIEKAREKNAASAEDLQTALGERNEARAALELAKAAEAAAKLNLEFCRLKAPISGRIGDCLIDEGNLVTGGPSGSILLATIVSVDPIEVIFDADENTLQRLMQAVRDGRLEGGPQSETSIPVEVGLPIHQNSYPVPGTISFVNNQVDSKTGTIQIKALCPNPKPEKGSRLLVPGMFVRVRVPIGKPRTALMIPEAALGSEQGNRFLYTIDGQNKVVRLNAEIGVLSEDLREIISVRGAGDSADRPLLPDESIIVRGIQRVRQGATVAPLNSAEHPLPTGK